MCSSVLLVSYVRLLVTIPPHFFPERRTGVDGKPGLLGKPGDVAVQSPAVAVALGAGEGVRRGGRQSRVRFVEGEHSVGCVSGERGQRKPDVVRS